MEAVKMKNVPNCVYVTWKRIPEAFPEMAESFWAFLRIRIIWPQELAQCAQAEIDQRNLSEKDT